MFYRVNNSKPQLSPLPGYGNENAERERERERVLMMKYWKTHLKFENHLTSWAVLFLLNLMSGKYILRMAEDGYLTQKNINFAFLKCIGVSVEFWLSDME